MPEAPLQFPAEDWPGQAANAFLGFLYVLWLSQPGGPGQPGFVEWLGAEGRAFVKSRDADPDPAQLTRRALRLLCLAAGPAALDLVATMLI